MKSVLSVAYDDMFHCYRVCVDGRVVGVHKYETAEDAQDVVDNLIEISPDTYKQED